MIMKRSEPQEMEHWEKEVAPRMRGDEELILDAPHDQKVELLGRAHATLVPIQWPEPFGLVMIESMACGTPVLAMPKGAAPEVLIDGKTGWLTETVDDMVDAVDRAGEISPAACREHVVENFSGEAMVHKTEQVLEQIVNRR
jgi:glycosyltransferase involved in cell wall biosynthesis